MKTAEIVAGGVYHDGKQGVREIVKITGSHISRKAGAPFAVEVPRVTYRILAAKVEQEYSYADKKVVSLIGSTTSCELRGFSQWAKVRVEPGARDGLLAELAAKKLRLPPGEKSFMESVAAEYRNAAADTPPKAGSTVSFDKDEVRAAQGIAKKGLAQVAMAPPGFGGEITLTELGAAWIRQVSAEQHDNKE